MTLRTVHRYDELKDKFGGPYRLDIDTPGEAVRALSANFKDLMPTIRDGEWSLVMGEDIETGDSLDETMVGYSSEIPISISCPVWQAAKTPRASSASCSV